MKLRTVFVFNTIVAIVYALCAFIIPETTLEMHGLGTDASTMWMGRFFAVELLGVGLVTWLVRDSEPGSTQRGIVLGLMIHDVVGIIIAVWATLTGGMNALGWLPVALYVLLAAGYANFYFRE
jgi:hypothetical protein